MPPQILNPPCCEFINQIPWWAFLVIHLAIFLFAAVYAGRGFAVGQRGFGWGFTLIALGEISYMTYHVNITTFLFAHTISEVLVLLGIITLFAAALRAGVLARREMGSAASVPPGS